MTLDAKRLLLIVAVLLLVQWFAVPLIIWQNEQVRDIEQNLESIAARESLAGSVGVLETETQLRLEALDALKGLAFAQSPTAKLKMQRLVRASLEDKQLMVDKFEWSPQAPGTLAVLRARVSIRGGADNLFDWMTGLQFEEPWINVLAFKVRHAGGRVLDADKFIGDLTLQFVLSGAVDE